VASTMSPTEPGIAMLGAEGSGKSTFLGVLDHALIEKNCGWHVWSPEPASRKLMSDMSTALTSRGEFPLPTLHIDTFDWILSGEVAHTVRKGRFSSGTIKERAEITLKLTDATGELGRPSAAGRADREELVGHLANSRGLLYMFDPVREFTWGDAYETTNSLTKDLMAAVHGAPDFDGRLPHHVAVCITKLDEPRVFKTAHDLGLLMWDDQDPRGFPRVHETDARALLDTLCKVGRKGMGEALPLLLEQSFHADRISYYVTSAVGFMVDRRTRRFDIQDTENVYRTASGKTLIRGPVHPINVVEPVLWLVKKLALSE